MSVLVGVISALLIIALVVILVLRLQHGGSSNERRKHNKSVNSSNCDHRGSVSGPTLSDKGGDGKLRKDMISS